MTDDEEIRLLLREDEEVSVQVDRPKKLMAPVEEDTVVGSVRYYLGNELVREFPVTVQCGVEKISLHWCAGKILERMLL